MAVFAGLHYQIIPSYKDAHRHGIDNPQRDFQDKEATLLNEFNFRFPQQLLFRL